MAWEKGTQDSRGPAAPIFRVKEGSLENGENRFIQNAGNVLSKYVI
jgi:hypothetical protein